MGVSRWRQHLPVMALVGNSVTDGEVTGGGLARLIRGRKGGEGGGNKVREEEEWVGGSLVNKT